MYHIKSEEVQLKWNDLLGVAKQLSARGFKVSEDASDMLSWLQSKVYDSVATIKEKYGIDNPNSPKQVVAYLRVLASRAVTGEGNIIVSACCDESGKWTSNAAAMEDLAEHGIKFAQDILDYRDYKKRVDCIKSLIDTSDENGMVHPVASVGSTGRIIFSNPALFSIHKDILWNVLKPIRKGDALFSIDIKNQEPHVLFNMTNSTELLGALTCDEGLYEFMFKKAFRPTVTIVANVADVTEPVRITRSSENKYNIPAADWFDHKASSEGFLVNGVRITSTEGIAYAVPKGGSIEPPKEVFVKLADGSIEGLQVKWENPEALTNIKENTRVTGVLKGVEQIIPPIERKEFKTSYLAIQYGGSIAAIRKACHVLDANTVFSYITGVEGIKNYRQMARKFARTKPRRVKTVFGTELELPREAYANSGSLERTIMNYPIQGTGADILKLLIKHFEEEIKARKLGMDFQIYMPRHDELIVEVSKEFMAVMGKEKAVDILEDILEHQIDDWAPFKMEIKQVA